VRRYALLFTLLLSTLSASEWGSYGELTGRSNGYRKGAGLYGFAPICQGSDAIFFGQALGGRYWDVWTGSVGLGLRRCAGVAWVWGANGFLDLAYTDQHNLHSQIGFGLEFIGPCLQLRANGYLPLDRQQQAGDHFCSRVVVEGTQLMSAHDRVVATEHVYRGFDVEATGCVDIFCGSILATAGYFYYSTPGLRDVTGPRVRLEYRIDDLLGWIGSTLFFGGEYEYNQVYHNYGSAFAGVRFPLGRVGRAQWCCSPCSPRRQMGERVRRAEAIFMRKRDCVEPQTVIGLPASLIYLAPVEGEEADGTAERPFGLTKGVEQAGPGSILVLTGEHEGAVALQEGQTLVGVADGLMTPWGPLRAPLAKERPKVEGTVQLADGSRVLGVEATAVRSNADGTELRDVVGDQLTIEGRDHWVRNSQFGKVDASGADLHFVENRLGEVTLSGEGLIDLRDNEMGALHAEGAMQLRAWKNQVAGGVDLAPRGDAKFDLRNNEAKGLTVRQEEGHLEGQIRGSRLSDKGIDIELEGSALLSVVGNEVTEASGPAIDVRATGEELVQLSLQGNRDEAKGEESPFPVVVYQVASTGKGVQLMVNENSSSRSGVKLLNVHLDGEKDELYAPGGVAQGHPELRLNFHGSCTTLKDPTPQPSLE
jgi:Inverse autotransporter, beta-domain